MIRFYQLFSAGMPRRCRFAPSCSEYMRQSILQRGFWKGLAKGMSRILKCHPWHPGGWDPALR